MQADIQWLHLIDTRNYPDAWSSASKVMQSAISESALADAISRARAPLGLAGDRTVKQVTTATKLPGAPDGNFVIVQYATHFANRSDAIETVVTSENSDGTWQVAGYFIR